MSTKHEREMTHLEWFEREMKEGAAHAKDMVDSAIARGVGPEDARNRSSVAVSCWLATVPLTAELLEHINHDTNCKLKDGAYRALYFQLQMAREIEDALRADWARVDALLAQQPGVSNTEVRKALAKPHSED